MLPGHYGFSPRLDHCLVTGPQGNSIRWHQTIFMVLVIPIHRNRIKGPRGIPNTSGHRPMRKRNCPDITTFTMSNNPTNRFFPHSKYRTSTRPQSGHQIRRKCFPRSLSRRVSMPNFNNLPTTNSHNSRFSNTSTSLLC